MIKILKLISGEELIADVVESNGTFTLDKPCALHMVPSRSNPEQPSMALIPYAAYTEDHKISVNSSSVVWSETPLKELYNQYNSIFGNGIVVANNLVN